MKIAYFDCFSGASGDMILGALLDAGLNLDLLKGELSKLKISHYGLELRSVEKRGIGGTRAVVTVDDHHHGHHHRHLSDIEGIIGESGLDEVVKSRSVQIFRRLAEAEAKVHRTGVEQVHFHEVGAMDAIIDIVGSVAGLSALGIEKIFCSPLNTGSGTVKCAHGVLPVPAPATAELIKGFPFYSTDVVGELLTPTGAAILTTLSAGFGHIPAMTLESCGYGAGEADPPTANLLRVLIGREEPDARRFDFTQNAVIEAGIDDMNPQIYGYLMNKALEMGALDVFLTPVQMKKNRPGTLITILCQPNRVEEFAALLVRETTTIGLRWRIDNKLMASRSIKEVSTPFGTIRCKVAEMGGGIVNARPEFEDCKRAAAEHDAPLKDVMESARAAALELLE